MRGCFFRWEFYRRALFALIICAVAGVGIGLAGVFQRMAPPEPPAVPKSRCQLCHPRPDSEFSKYFGTDNLAIIYLNSFHVVPVAFNPVGQEQADESDAFFRAHGLRRVLPGAGFFGVVFINRARGYARAALTLPRENRLDRAQAGRAVCADCLDGLRTEGAQGDRTELALYNFSTGTLVQLKDVIEWRDGNYLAVTKQTARHFSGDRIRFELLIFHCPKRPGSLLGGAIDQQG